jgi:hypothetical protein
MANKRIEGVTVSVGYADFLSWALTFNAKQFDKLVVVTTPDDEETKRVCDFHKIEYIESSDCYHEGQKFAKHRLINVGLKALKLDDWVVHFDADIVLPPGTIDVIRKSTLDSTCIYGMDRVEFMGANALFDFISNPFPVYQKNGFIRTDKFKVLTRVGWGNAPTPLGFFQLWSPIVSDTLQYATGLNNAGSSDIWHILKWQEVKRRWLTNVLAFHLESEASNIGTNWKGRVTAPFMIDSVPKEKLVKPDNWYG